MKHFACVISVLALVLLSSAAVAGDADAGKAKSAVCAACHGGNGISPNAIWPNLAGQKAEYLIAQLKAFKAGERKNAQMSAMVAGLSDDDIANLAAYYSALGCE